MPMGPGAPTEPVPGFAVVRFGIDRKWLRPGDELSFGRGPDRDIRIGHSPSDDLVSRNAGSLTGLRDGVLIRNTSATQAIRYIAMPGPELSIGPGMAVGTMPFPHERLDVMGRHGACYTLHVDTRGVAAAPRLDRVAAGASASAPEAASTRFEPDHQLTARELRLLAALCEPLLTLAGGPPATYREIAARLGGGATPKAVRTGLDRLRNRLADEDGLPGLRADDDDGPGTPRYVAVLARWAIDTGQVDGQVLDRVLPPR